MELAHTDDRARHTLVLAVAGLVMLLAAWLQLGAARTTIIEQPVRADAAEYVAYAYNLREHGVYSRDFGGDTATPPPDAVRPPGYPLLLAGLMQPSPDPGFVRRTTLVQAVLGVLNVLLAMLIARRVVGDRWALLAGALCAASPHLVAASTYLLTETLFTTVLLLALLCASEGIVRGRTLLLVAAGALLGAASLVRSTTLLLPLALLALAALAARRRPPLLRGAVLALAATLVVMLPWTLRNAALPDSAERSQLLVNFIHHGAYPDLMYEGRPASYGYPYLVDPDSAAKGASVGAALAAVADGFRDAPARYAWWYAVGKPLTFLQWSLTEQNGEFFVYPALYSPYHDRPLFRATAQLMRIAHWPLTVLALAACLWLIPRRRRATPADAVAWVLAATLLYALAIHTVGAPFPRYAVPFKPVLYILAVCALAALAGRWWPLRHARDGIAAPAATQ